MGVIKAIYHNGVVDLLEKPTCESIAQVLIVFPEEGRKIQSLRGRMPSSGPLNYSIIEDDLKHLSQKSEAHLLRKVDE